MPRPSHRLVLALSLAAMIYPVVAAGQVDDLAKGRFLVAREGLRDPNFSRTVILLVSYDASGAAGVVLNRPSHMRLDHLVPHLELSPEANEQVYIGGPMAIRRATVLFSNNSGSDRAARIIGNVQMTGDLAILETMITEPRPGEKFRVYAGHAGWGPGQLESEIRRRGWHILQGSEAAVFSDSDDDLWETLIRRTRSLIAMQ